MFQIDIISRASHCIVNSWSCLPSTNDHTTPISLTKIVELAVTGTHNVNILGKVNCGKLKSAFDSINWKLCGWLVLSNNVECLSKLTELIFTVFWLLSGAMRAYAGIWCWYLQQGEGATGSHTSLSVRQNKSCYRKPGIDEMAECVII